MIYRCIVYKKQKDFSVLYTELQWDLKSFIHKKNEAMIKFPEENLSLLYTGILKIKGATFRDV